MKISMEWLNDYLPGAASEVGAERAAEALMNGGLPVETIERVGEDTVIDVEVTSNRADCLSHVGIAREVATIEKSKVQSPKSKGQIKMSDSRNASLSEVDPLIANAIDHEVARQANVITAVVSGLMSSSRPRSTERRNCLEQITPTFSHTVARRQTCQFIWRRFSTAIRFSA